MSGYYPPGVTGCEPEIIGTGYEDKCTSCLETGAPRDAIQEGTISVPEGNICIDCFEAWCEENDLVFSGIEGAILHRYKEMINRSKKDGTD